MENKQQLKLEVLMSVMHQKDFSIAQRTKISSNLLVINQCDEDKYEEINVNGYKWRMISTRERGSHLSRQMALDNAQGEICLFCDDDEELADGYSDIILKAYEKLPNASAIVFNVTRNNNKNKKSYYWIKKIRKAPKYRGYGTPMLSLKLGDIQKHGIRMNEIFGAGSVWGGGEDSLFEDEIRKSGLKMYEYPATIANIDYANGSTWIDEHNEKYFYNIGGFSEYKYKKNFLIKFVRRFYTAIRLRKDKTLSFKDKMRWMYLGGRGFLQNITYKDFMEKENAKTSNR